MGVKLPDAIHDDEIEFSQEGLSTLAQILGGLTVLGILGAAAGYLKGRFMDMAGAGEGANSLINVN